MVPSSSAHWAVGSTTSASSAVSERKMSETTKKSRSASRLRTRFTSGAETTRLEASSQQGPDAAGGAHPVEHLVRRQARLGQLVGVDAPDRGHVGPVGRVGELAVAGQLVGLLPVLAAALAVALAGDGAVAGVRLAGQPEGEGEIDEGLRGVGAVAVLLGAAGGEDHRRLGGGQGVHGLAQVGHRRCR